MENKIGRPAKADCDRLRDNRLLVGFPVEKQAELKIVAREQGMSVSAFIRNATYIRLDELRKAA